MDIRRSPIVMVMYRRQWKKALKGSDSGGACLTAGELERMLAAAGTVRCVYVDVCQETVTTASEQRREMRCVWWSAL